MSSLSFAKVSREFSPSQDWLVSSANNVAFVVSRQLGRSFMYKRNKIGPRLDPCGTPHLTSLLGDIVQITEQTWFLFLTYDLIQSRLFPLMPYRLMIYYLLKQLRNSRDDRDWSVISALSFSSLSVNTVLDKWNSRIPMLCSRCNNWEFGNKCLFYHVSRIDWKWNSPFRIERFLEILGVQMPFSAKLLDKNLCAFL